MDRKSALRGFIMGKETSDPDTIVSESARRVLYEYREGQDESRELVSVMLENGMSFDLVYKISGLAKG